MNLLTVFFDSTSNTADATVGAGTSKTYTLGGTVAGLGASGGVVSVSLKGDTSAAAIAQATAVSGSSVWSPLSTTTIGTTNLDWVNGYALSKGCFASVGIGSDCNNISLSK
jgi:hypothetical protein